MKTIKNEHHHFAFYVKNFSTMLEKNSIYLTDDVLCHRIGRVTRLKEGDTLTLFDELRHAIVFIKSFEGKKSIIFTVVDTFYNKKITPEIICFVPVLKRESLEKAVYTAVELGANILQLVVTEKIHRQWIGKKELDRLKYIMIAAAEQAKQFLLPEIREPIALSKAIAAFEDKKDMRLFLDPSGIPLFEIIAQVHIKKPPCIILAFGPEGDCTQQEKEMLRAHGFVFCALTPTVIRAFQAFSLGLGVIRSTAQ